MKNNKKYKLIVKAKNHIVDYGHEVSLHPEYLQDLIGSCKGRTMKKYVKHVLRCGAFYNDWFHLPSTRMCLDSKIKNRPLTFEYDYED